MQTKEDFFRQKMGLTNFNIDLTNLKIPLQTLFNIFKWVRILKYLSGESLYMKTCLFDIHMFYNYFSYDIVLLFEHLYIYGNLHILHVDFSRD